MDALSQRDVPPPVRVLVVDDEEAFRFVLEEALKPSGYDVKTASDGDEAIELLKVETFDVVLLDVKMKRVDGFEVLKYAKAHCPETRVIMLTAYGDARTAIESFHLGASGILGKPCDLNDVLTTIERTLYT